MSKKDEQISDGLVSSMGLNIEQIPIANVTIDDSVLRNTVADLNPMKKKKYDYPEEICPICNNKYRNKYTLKQHMKRHDENAGPLKSRARLPRADVQLQFKSIEECMEYVDKLYDDLQQCKKYLQENDTIAVIPEATLPTE